MGLLLVVVLAAVSVFAVPEYKDLDLYTEDIKDDRIIGGVPAAIEEFPFIVSLLILATNTSRYKGGFLCGGTIVTEDWVLTAAHCLNFTTSIDGVWKRELYVRAGSSFQHRGGIMRRVTEMVSHNYPPHDIGLIKVGEPWPLNGYTISRACLPRQDDPVPAGSRATIMGWGRTDPTGTFPEVLMKQEVIVISYAVCSASWIWLEKQFAITEKKICTFFDPSENPSSAFEGDSGSPVVVNGEVVGIVSFGSNESFVPIYHTRVSAYIDWIEEIVGPLPSAD